MRKFFPIGGLVLGAVLAVLAAGCTPGFDFSTALANLLGSPPSDSTGQRAPVGSEASIPNSSGSGGEQSSPPLLGGTAVLSSLERVTAFGLGNVRGMAYNPGPSNYTKTAGGIYYDSDFQADDFNALWGTGPDGRGRDDLRRFQERLGINFIHPYDWSAPPARTHTAYFAHLNELGMGTAVSFSNFVMGLILGVQRQDWYGSPDNQRNVLAKGIISRTLDEVYGGGTTPNQAVRIIKVFNEFDLNYQANDNIGAVVVALEFVHQYEQAKNIPDSNRLPIMAPTSFGVFQGIEGGDIKRVFTKVAQSSILPSNFWTTRMIYATNPQNDGPDITSYLTTRWPAWLTQNGMPALPMLFTELGSSTDQAGGENALAERFKRQIDASAPGQNQMIGACIFLNERRPWEAGAEQNFGLLKFGPDTDWARPASNYTQAQNYRDPGNTNNFLSGSYPVEQQYPVPAYLAVKSKWGP